MSNGQRNMRKVEASRGWQWLVQALAMVRRWPRAFLPMGLVIAAISMIPLLGGLVILVLGPALLAGAVTAARLADGGGNPSVGHLFHMFQDEQRRKPALQLCVPLVVGKIAASLVVGIAMAGAMLRAGVDLAALERDPQQLMALLEGSNMLVWLLVALAILLLAWAFTVLAIARVALDDAPAFASMGESFRLVLHNLGAWLVLVIVLFLGLFLLALPLVLLGVPALMQLATTTALYALLGPLLYLAWRDLCGDAVAPPAPPGPPPPPSRVLEA